MKIIAEAGCYKCRGWLYIQYWLLDKSQKEISEYCKSGRSTISRYFKKYKIPLKFKSEIIFGKKKYHSKKWLYDQYWIQNKTLKEITISCEATSESTIRLWLNKHNIKKKTSKDQKKRIVSNETKIKISESLSGRKLTELHKNNISKANKGKEFSEEHKQKLSLIHKNKPKYYNRKEKNNKWKGEKASKSAKHQYIAKYKLKTNKCEICKNKKKLTLSFNHSLGDYTRNIEDYQWLCRSCHKKRDIYEFNKIVDLKAMWKAKNYNIKEQWK